MQNNIPSLTVRLLAAAELVRCGATVADVGTDHAYLPIHLVKNGVAEFAVASDINEGPYLRAKSNVESCGLQEKIATLHTAGLCGVEKFSPTDILICGMGGELITSILSDAPWTRDNRIRLILQPMTHAEILRDYLIKNAFSLICERTVKECDSEGRIYQIICAEYTGEDISREQYTDAELLLGKREKCRKEDESTYLELLERHIATTKKIRSAKLFGNPLADVSSEERILEMLCAQKELKHDR